MILKSTDFESEDTALGLEREQSNRLMIVTIKCKNTMLEAGAILVGSDEPTLFDSNTVLCKYKDAKFNTERMYAKNSLVAYKDESENISTTVIVNERTNLIQIESDILYHESKEKDVILSEISFGNELYLSRDYVPKLAETYLDHQAMLIWRYNQKNSDQPIIL